VIIAVAPEPATITANYNKGGITKTDVEGELPYWN